MIWFGNESFAALYSSILSTIVLPTFIVCSVYERRQDESSKADKKSPDMEHFFFICER